MTMKLTKVSDTYLEPSDLTKILNGFRKKAPPWILDWVLNTPLSILRNQESGALVMINNC